MRKIKSFISIFLVVISLLSLVSCASAKDYSDVVVKLVISNPIMEVNGKNEEIDDGRGTTPVIINNRTLVPIRAIIEAFGGSVSWNEGSQCVLLAMNGNKIELYINSPTAFLNGDAHTLDTAPVIINERTMLPIRFIAEGFNIGVAWEAEEQRVSLIRNTFDDDEYKSLMAQLDPYSDKPYAVINNNVPMFKDYEIIGGSFEYYSELDSLGRCDVCMASVAEDIMPTEKRGDISMIKPTGWINKRYDNVAGGYLYNRCHLIGYQLTGENANRRNLITGTRYMNNDGMLPFENMIDDYVDKTGNHVMYRVTPVFSGNNLVADGVLMEAYSVEDNGKGISFCIYCYNVQPDIFIDYATGNSSN